MATPSKPAPRDRRAGKRRPRAKRLPPRPDLGPAPKEFAAVILHELMSRVMPSEPPTRPHHRVKKWERYVRKFWQQDQALDDRTIGRLAWSAPWRAEQAIVKLARDLATIRKSRLPESSASLRAALRTTGPWT